MPNKTKKSAPRHSLRLVCLSDTHELHRQLTVPDGDILIHAGDLTVFDPSLSRSVRVLEDVNDWLQGLPHRHKIVIAGNHDLIFQAEPKTARALLTEAHYLENTGIELEGLRFWGSPITPVISSMAFAMERGPASQKIWAKIPTDTDILITHGPPFGTGDQNEPWSQHWGCPSLAATTQRIQPRLHIFGHIHGGYGQESNRNGTMLINCAAMNNKQELANLPVVVDLQIDQA